MCRRGNSLFPRRRNGRSRLLNEGWVVFVFNTASQRAAGRMLDLLLCVDVLQSAVLTVMGALGKLCTRCRIFWSPIWAYMYSLRRLDEQEPATRWRMLSSLLTRLSAREGQRAAEGGVEGGVRSSEGCYGVPCMCVYFVTASESVSVSRALSCPYEAFFFGRVCALCAHTGLREQIHLCTNVCVLFFCLCLCLGGCRLSSSALAIASAPSPSNHVPNPLLSHSGEAFEGAGLGCAGSMLLDYTSETLGSVRWSSQVWSSLGRSC